jgi:PadR family transcriptional regulator
VKMTAPLERVLRAFLADPAGSRYGYDLMKATGLKSGTLYPLLGRLENEELVTSAWETPQQDGQRPRKYYRLTARGAEVARLELAQISAGRRRSPARPAPGSLGSWGERGTPAAAHRRVPDRPRVPAPAGRGTGSTAGSFPAAGWGRATAPPRWMSSSRGSRQR